MKTGMTAIRYYSFTNPWIDFMVTVLNDDVKRATEIIQNAMDMYWDYEYECYGDAVEGQLAENKIPYFIQYIPWDHENDHELGMDWEWYIGQLSKDHTIIHIHS